MEFKNYGDIKMQTSLCSLVIKIILVSLVVIINGCTLVENTDIPVIDATTSSKEPTIKPIPKAQTYEGYENYENPAINSSEAETITIDITEDAPISGEIYSDADQIADTTRYANPNYSGISNYPSLPGQMPSLPRQNEPTTTPQLITQDLPGQQQSNIPAPNHNQLHEDEQLPAPILSLLNEASSHQKVGNLNLAAATLERAQRIAPREPAVLYHLASIRLQQNNSQVAEQIATQALLYANGKPQTQAKLWYLISDCRTKNNDHTGAVQALEQAQLFSNF